MVDPCRIPTLLDHSRTCTSFSAVISRHRDSYVKIDELDGLQHDLEQLLQDAESRLSWLHTENDNIECSDKQGSSDSSDCPSLSPKPSPKGITPTRIAGTKRGPGRPTNSDRPPKNMKLHKRLMKNKAKNIAEPGPSHIDTTPPVLLPAVMDAPNKFWQTLEPWCSDITHEDVSNLKELLQPHPQEEDFYKVPALGMHYSQQWALEDLMEEQKESSEPHSRNNDISTITMATLNNNDSNSTSTLGPLTQKLLSALVEEDITQEDDDKEDYSLPSPEHPIQNTWIGGPNVEKRIKEELIDLGILHASDDESEDEVLTELLSKQQELRELVGYNKQQIQLLYDTAVEYRKQQEIRHKVDVIDEEVVDTYRNFMYKKHKKTPYTKKEKDAAAKLLSEREELNKQLLENSFLSTLV